VSHRLALPLLALSLAACTRALPVPPMGDHAGDELVQPTVPVPPGKVQIVGDPPATMKKPYWIDGEWEWNGRRWAWKEGRWEEPPPGMCCWAPATTWRRTDGTLAHLRGGWKKEPAAK
jgi:hypothetical protein